jgi:hypothetical protein
MKEPLLPSMSTFVPATAPEEQTLRRRAAVPNLVLGAIYAAAGCAALLVGGTGYPWLGSTMAIEVLVIHSFPFLMLIASYEPATKRGKLLQKIIFWTMLGVYILHTLKAGGVSGAFVFAGLTVSTYLGYLLRRISPDAVKQLILRWVMSFAVFLVSSAVTGMPGDFEEWTGSGRTPYFGMLYFTTLGLLELKGFYRMKKVQQVADHIKDVFNKSRKG